MRYSFTAENILIGGYFDTPRDIIFSSIYVTYRGAEINRWLNKQFQVRGFFESSQKESFVKYTHIQSVKVKINDSYNITVLAKPRVLSSFKGQVRGGFIKETLGLEIESLKEEKKSLGDYFKTNLVVLDFLGDSGFT